MHRAVLTALAVAALSASALRASSQEMPKITCAGHVANGQISVGGHKVDIVSAPNANPMKLQFSPGLPQTPVMLLTPAVPGNPFIQDVSPGSVLIGNPPSHFHFVCIEK
jgi:hypothetical protein